MDTSNKQSGQHYLLGIGNPIIDISAEIDSDQLKQYSLNWGRTIFADDSNMGFYDELEKKSDVSYIPGGSVTNSIRIAGVIFYLFYFSGF